jgi:hypothetical protein
VILVLLVIIALVGLLVLLDVIPVGLGRTHHVTSMTTPVGSSERAS